MARKKTTRPASARTLYLVIAHNWPFNEYAFEYDAGDTYYCPDGPGEGNPVKLFADWHRAESFRRQKEQESRAEVNPFAYRVPQQPFGEPCLEDHTSFDAARFHDWLLDAGLEPPAPDAKGNANWPAWWDERAPHMTDLQKAKVWEALDKVRFYEVVEVIE